MLHSDGKWAILGGIFRHCGMLIFFPTCCVTCMKNINQQIHQTVAECTYHTKQHTASRKGLGYNMNNDVSG